MLVRYLFLEMRERFSWLILDYILVFLHKVNIRNPTWWFIKFDAILCPYIFTHRWTTSRFVEITDKQISEIKINSVDPKNTKYLCIKLLKQLSPQARWLSPRRKNRVTIFLNDQFIVSTCKPHLNHISIL